MDPRFHFTQEEREAIYRVIRERRDVRRFRSDPLPEDAIQRILEAAMQAPSVGFMQPWNFILVAKPERKREVYNAFVEANQEAQEKFTNERKELYSSLKLEGILSSPLNICITCDRSRFGPVVLGRTSQPEMDLYSAVCAVQNLWLAARCEGIGVGWVSIIKPESLKKIFRLPESVVPIAYLCVGYCDSFTTEPELKTFGWLPEIEKAKLIFREEWGRNPPH